MPAHARRSLRPVLLIAVAVGVIGASSAGIAVARSSSDDSRTAASAPVDAEPLNATPGPDLETELAADPLPPSSSPTASPSPSTTTTAKPTPTPTAKPTTAAPRPTRTKTTKRPTKSPTKTKTPTTQPPAPEGGSSDTVTEVIRLVNAERSKAGCGALTGDARLHRSAKKHSDRQAAQETMSHQLPGEASMGDRVSAEGYRWGGVAENVAAGYQTPAAVMEGWMNSAGHKANILNCGYKNIGVGVTKSGKGTRYWTQNFASPL
ncbi:CAP domain-containing protein [Actinoplanes sp. Pm04-4]|uniref:CAP domain-containing protein n=1 Tax=Paractinoplanes pyxinae TaxID=2997416 RepID=A0ABT4AQT3_9ACTN|nr:CAP domain-containing protein [Actinoplanes pyxinae]MCY1136598.1 CAP domain-containing protein [Actinoplanes pyxinae]